MNLPFSGRQFLADREKTESSLPPPVMHARSVRGLFRVDDDGNMVADEVLAAAEAGMSAAYSATRKVIALRDALAADQTLPPAAAALRLKDAALAAGVKATDALDKAREGLLAETRKVAAATLPAVHSDPAMASEIRSAMRGLSDRERQRQIDVAIAEGDGETIGSILGAKPYLSGVTPHGAANIQAFWRARHHPDEADRLERLQQAESALDLAGAAAVKFAQELATSPLAREASASSERTREALAAIAEAAE